MKNRKRNTHEYKDDPSLSKFGCPVCGSNISSIVDTRFNSQGIRRRRECSECNTRYTTLETVVSSDKSRALAAPVLRRDLVKKIMEVFGV